MQMSKPFTTKDWLKICLFVFFVTSWWISAVVDTSMVPCQHRIRVMGLIVVVRSANQTV